MSHIKSNLFGSSFLLFLGVLAREDGLAWSWSSSILTVREKPRDLEGNGASAPALLSC